MAFTCDKKKTKGMQSVSYYSCLYEITSYVVTDNLVEIWGCNLSREDYNRKIRTR